MARALPSLQIFTTVAFFLTGCAQPGPLREKPAASSTSVAVKSAPPLSGKTNEVVVLHFSDLHGHLRADFESGGYARLAALIDREKKAAAAEGLDALVVFGGDAAGKSALPCRNTQERACFDLLNRLQIDVAVLGNGELKRSAAELNDLLAQTHFPWIGTNVRSLGPRALWQHEYLYSGPVSGVKVALAGWTTLPNPGEVDLKKAKLDVRTGTPSGGEMNAWNLRFKGLPVLWVTHQEDAGDQKLSELACNDKALDSVALLKGHTHKVRAEKFACLPYYEAGSFATGLDRLRLRKGSDGHWTVAAYDLLKVTAQDPEDPKVAEAIAALYREKAPHADEVVAELPAPRSIPDFAHFLGEAYQRLTHADLAIVNLGAIKEDLPAGPLTRERLSLIHPYDDELMGLDWGTKDLERSLCKAATRPREEKEDAGSDLVLVGAELKEAGTPQCHLEGPRRASYKVALVSYLIRRSKRWLGKDLAPQAFKFGLKTDRAIELELKQRGNKI